MNKQTLHLQKVVGAAIIAAVAIMIVGFQYVQAAFTKAAAQGEALRVSEHNSCAPSEDGERPNFSGCNSLI